MFKKLANYYGIMDSVESEVNSLRGTEKWVHDETIRIIQSKLLPFIGI